MSATDFTDLLPRCLSPSKGPYLSLRLHFLSAREPAATDATSVSTEITASTMPGCHEAAFVAGDRAEVVSGMNPGSTVARLYAIDSALSSTPPSNRSAIRRLAFVPNLVVWAASWFTEPGFALGTGSAVSPLGNYLELLPAVPLLGAFPASDMELARAGLLIPMSADFLAAAVRG